MNQALLQRYQAVCHRIESLSGKQKPLLLAVSKKHPASSVRTLYQAGQRSFGENYAQEALDKMQLLSDLAIEWHFIGPIQSNKTKLIAENFDWVQSVDRLKVLKRLSLHRSKAKPPLQLLLQYKVGDELSKSGADSDDLISLYESAQSLSHIKVRGLMCIPPASSDYAEQCLFLNQARTLFDAMREKDPNFNVLSMGMSGDLKAAIDCGSTLVRIGTDIFGART